MKKKSELRYDSLLLQLDTAVIRGYSVVKRDSFESFTYVDNSLEESHTENESHNHVVIVIKDQLKQEHVIDLAGAQFGIFGDDNFPHIVILPIDKWRNRFDRCSDSVARFPKLGGKLDRIRMIAEIVFNFYFNISSVTKSCVSPYVITTPLQDIATKEKEVEQTCSEHVTGTG